MNAQNTVGNILKELGKLGTPSTKRMLMNNHGIKEPCFGVKIGDMKPIVKRIKSDYQLALDLYATGNYDAMYLAGLIAEDERMTKKDLQQWAKKAYGGSLPGYTVAWVAAGSRHGWEMGLKWIESPKAHVAAAGWSTLACLMGMNPDEEIDLPHVKKLIERIIKTIHEVPDLVRYWMNGFLIAVGCGVSSLTDTIKKAAQKIGPVKVYLGNNQCKTPSIEDYILKVEQRGGIGKKRKNIKC
jgi:3-methyladenine DNA glycosylase AlkD